jgi:putative transposase
MQKKFDIRGRRSIRLKGWDYSTPHYYFVTLCVQNKANLFATIIDGKLILTEIGSMVEEIWLDMQLKYPGITVDEYVVMPNHIHGILGLHVGAGSHARPSHQRRCKDPGADTVVRPYEKSLSLSDVIRQFKTWSTKKYAENMIRLNWPEFHKRLWQQNFFERIVRCEKELDQIRQYILNNPANWKNDDENPADER